MIRNKKLLYFIILLGTLNSCSIVSNTKRFNNNETGWRPGDFNPNEGILLIVEGSWKKKQTEKIISFMEESYPYKYEIVSSDYQTSSKYNDKTEYRFVLESTYLEEPFEYQRSDGRTVGNKVISYDFYFSDRLKEIQYPVTNYFSSFPSTLLKQILINCIENNSLN